MIFKNGRIFTIDGGDGSGKATQTELLVKRLKKEGYPVNTLDYPHDSAELGSKIREILKEGKVNKVDPLFFSTLYSFNRYDTRKLLYEWIRKGKNIILDRYMEANFGHQAAKLDTIEERLEMINKLQTYELKWLELPKSYSVIYLDLPPEYALKAMNEDGKRKNLDMHEKAGLDYKNKVRDIFLYCSENFNHWIKINCLDGNNQRISREDLSNRIFNILEPEFVNKKERKN